MTLVYACVGECVKTTVKQISRKRLIRVWVCVLLRKINNRTIFFFYFKFLSLSCVFLFTNVETVKCLFPLSKIARTVLITFFLSFVFVWFSGELFKIVLSRVGVCVC